MTPKRLKEIQDRCANASEGPWARGSLESYHGGGRNSGIPFRRVYRKADSEAIDQIVALEPPPIGTGQGRHDPRWGKAVQARDEQGQIEVEGANCDDDAEFIAHARQDIPDLLAEIERLRQVEPCPAGCEHGRVLPDNPDGHWERVRAPDGTPTERYFQETGDTCSTCEGTGTRAGADAVKAKETP